MDFVSGYCHIQNFCITTAGGKTNYVQKPLIDFLEDLYRHPNLSYPKFFKMDTQSKLGFIAAEILFRDLSMKSYHPEVVAVVLSNADASLDTDLRYQASIDQAPSPAAFVYTLANVVMGELCIRHGFQGENAFFISPKFDPAWLSEYVDLVMAQDHTRACVAGWVNVLGQQHDVFLYLVEKQKRGLAVNHTANALQKLYLQ